MEPDQETILHTIASVFIKRLFQLSSILRQWGQETKVGYFGVEVRICILLSFKGITILLISSKVGKVAKFGQFSPQSKAIHLVLCRTTA